MGEADLAAIEALLKQHTSQLLCREDLAAIVAAQDISLKRFIDEIHSTEETLIRRLIAPLVTLLARRENLSEALANRLIALLDRLIKVTEAFDAVRRELRDLVMSKDAERAELRHIHTVISERLAVISKDVDDSVREITGAFKYTAMPPPAPAAPLDMGITERMVGRVALYIWRSKPVLVATTLFTGTGIGAGIYHAFMIWAKR